MNKKDTSYTSIVFPTTRNAKQANLLLYKVMSPTTWPHQAFDNDVNFREIGSFALIMWQL